MATDDLRAMIAAMSANQDMLVQFMKTQVEASQRHQEQMSQLMQTMAAVWTQGKKSSVEGSMVDVKVLENPRY